MMYWSITSIACSHEQTNRESQSNITFHTSRSLFESVDAFSKHHIHTEWMMLSVDLEIQNVWEITIRKRRRTTRIHTKSCDAEHVYWLKCPLKFAVIWSIVWIWLSIEKWAQRLKIVQGKCANSRPISLMLYNNFTAHIEIHGKKNSRKRATKKISSNLLQTESNTV